MTRRMSYKLSLPSLNSAIVQNMDQSAFEQQIPQHPNTPFASFADDQANADASAATEDLQNYLHTLQEWC